MMISRKEFLKVSAMMSASAFLSRYVGIDKVLAMNAKGSHPNILLLLVDQQRIPPAYGPDEGEAQGLKEILGFRPISPDNPFIQFFPGYLRLRQNAVVLRTHYTASAACVPSRTCIMTGSYSTGVEQTDGGFKSAEDVPWLDPEGTPTIGDWFQAAGYYTPYYGKWHVSYPEGPEYLEPWGFKEWDKSYPDAHVGGTWNLGVYRDIGCADDVVEFLNGRAKDPANGPWFAVGSVVNPHDNHSWPVPWHFSDPEVGVVPLNTYPPSPIVPPLGMQSYEKEVPPDSGNFVRVDLNPAGFPEDNCSLPPTYAESLNDKPRCQYDYSLKWGLSEKAIKQKDGFPDSAYPFQLQGELATVWSLGYNRFYEYCHYLADLQLSQILQALDDSDLAENTIVVFLSDHGEMAGAHGGMIQKWHNAYEETIRVPMVISSPLVNKRKWRMRHILQPTSSIDLAPTLLGLAGLDVEELRAKLEAVHGQSNVAAFVGADLSSHIMGEREGVIRGPDGRPRTGVFFFSNDAVTELGHTQHDDMYEDYERFLELVNETRANGYPLAEGPVRQPNHVRALCTGDWKIVHYVDPNEVEPDEWELYCLTADPIEAINLVDFRTGEVRDDVTVPGLTKNQLERKNRQLKEELARQEAAMLGESS
ncbi:MAG: type phosphodiesterase / nucleotide pyrophosphatase family protein [Chloroflexi bacterium]|nr:type phosphodiesterase / nucleotide pyrophosphatase family protein [Chloroflexota bacterium]